MALIKTYQGEGDVVEMTYPQFLDYLYKDAIESDCVAPDSKLEFLGNHVFGFTTYSGDIDVILATQMVEVIKAIVEGATFDFIKDDTKHIQYITMCNMPFLKDKLEWGTSIRGAWIEEYGKGDLEIDFHKIPRKDFKLFCQGIIDWIK